MLKKIVVAMALMMSAPLAVPAASATVPDDECLLRAGCWVDGLNWVCPNPHVFALCDNG
jgi:hypothetical protein